MTYPPSPPPPPQSGPPHLGPPSQQANASATRNRTRALWLAIGIPVAVVILLFAILAVARLVLFPEASIDKNATLDKAQSVSVTAPNARMNFLPSADDQVHVTMTGTYAGPVPTLNTRMDGAVARIDIETSDQWWHASANLTLTVTLPPSLDLAAHGINGHITLNDLHGDIRLETAGFY